MSCWVTSSFDAIHFGTSTFTLTASAWVKSVLSGPLTLLRMDAYSLVEYLFCSGFFVTDKVRTWICMHHLNTKKPDFGIFSHLLPDLVNHLDKFYTFFRMTNECAWWKVNKTCFTFAHQCSSNLFPHSSNDIMILGVRVTGIKKQQGALELSWLGVPPAYFKTPRQTCCEWCQK